MSREVLDIVRGTDMDEFDRQIAMQCAPLIAGLVVSNILTIDEEYTDRVRELFLGTDISLITLIAKRGRISFFLYREKKLAEYLKDDEVVEFALSRSLSPTMVSEYNLKLIDKKLLQKKLKEYIELAGTVSDEE